MRTVEILDIPFARLTQAEAVETLETFLSEQTNHVIVTPNPEGVMQAHRNPSFAEALCAAELSLADGTGIIIASFLLRKKLPERVRGVDTTMALFQSLAEKKRETTVYFLGGQPGIAEQAKINIEARFPHLKVTGFHHGFFSESEEKKIIEEINALSPDILFVCTGMPRAEIFAHRNKKINARLTLCVGGTIDIIAGNVKLAPSFMRKIGLEWLHRLIRQPSRFKRMLDIPRFMFAVLKNM